ncbi:MAG: PHB depolymerase family esterase [Dehalococcoidia bacterium]
MARMALGLAAIFVFIIALITLFSDSFEGGPAPARPTPADGGPPQATTPTAAVSPASAEPTSSLTPTPGPPRAPDLGPRAGRPSAGCGRQVATGQSVWPVAVGPNTRRARLTISSRYQAAVPSPLMLSFHGSGRTATEQDLYTGLPAIAEREGFILATPEALGPRLEWQIPGAADSGAQGDLQFAVALIDDLAASHCIDLGRVYATGMSNGAEMASALACRRPELIAGIAPVALTAYDRCSAGLVSVVAFHGTDDALVPFDTIPGDVFAWANQDGCGGETTVERLGQAIEVRSYLSCPPGVAVVFFIMEGMGHQWPGTTLPELGAGPSSDEIVASEIIWTFFKARPKT